MALKVNRALTGTSLGIAGLMGVIFLVDLIVGIPFSRFSIVADVVVVLAAGLIVWQGIETWREL